MGAIRTLKDNGSSYTITSSVDGAVYSLICADCIIGGLGDMFDISYRTSSLNVSFAKGSQALIGGNAFWLEDSVDITLPSNSTIYLCLRIDPTKPSGQTGSFECLTESSIESGNVNVGAVRDLLIYTITTSGSGISNIDDNRVVYYGGEATVSLKAFNDYKTKNNSQIDNIKSLYEFLDATVKSLQNDVQGLNTSLNNEITNSNNNISNLTSEIKRLDTTISTVNTTLADIDKRVKDLEDK